MQIFRKCSTLAINHRGAPHSDTFVIQSLEMVLDWYLWPANGVGDCVTDYLRKLTAVLDTALDSSS